MTFPAWLQTIHHDGSPKYVSKTYPQLGETIRIKLRVATSAPVQQIYLRTFPDGEQAFTPMSKSGQDETAQWWALPLLIREPTTHYRFVLKAADGVWFYSAAGVTKHVPLDNTDFQILANYEPPAWVQTAVFYQIFPDRFANGNPATNPQPDEYQYRGFGPKTYDWHQPPDKDQPFPIVFYGGDLLGIEQKLDYLESLGVNAIYLNPIFTAYSNHKYDVADYDHVDPHFGGNEALISLRKALDARGMRYILDIVPNHCGYWHSWFQTAQADANAPEADFFTFDNHPDKYATWLGVWTLPKLNFQSEELRHRIFGAEDSVFRQWLRPPFSADGWRVDVANMLGRQGAVQQNRELSQQIRQAVKETRPDAYLMAENFFDATSQLQGDQFDGIMNYSGMAFPLEYWLNGYTAGAHGLHERIESSVSWPTEAVVATWQQHLAGIPWAIALQQFNLLGSHDVPRLRTILDENDALHRLALIVQFTFPGVPGLYYGDEVGMVDTPELGSRGCMVWDESVWNQDLLAFYKKLIKLRRETAVIQTGGFQIVAVEQETLAFQREGTTGRTLTIAHRAKTPRAASPLPLTHTAIPNGTRFVEQFTGQELIVIDGALPLPAHPQGATLWIAD